MYKKIWNKEVSVRGKTVSPKTIIKHPFFAGSVLMVGGSMGINVINYIYHIVMSQQMGPETYGELKSIFSILIIISIVPLSTSFAIVKFVSATKSKEEKRRIYHAVNKIVFRISIIFSVIVLLVATPVSKFLHLGESLSVFLIAPILFFTQMALVNKATLQGMLKFIGVVAPDFVVGFVKFTLGIALVMLGFSLPGATAAILVGAILAYLTSSFLVKKEISMKPSKRKYDVKPILTFALPVLLQSLAFTSLISNDILLVKHFLPSTEAGLYAALSTLGLIIYFAAQPVTSVMFPIVAGKKSRGENYRKIFYLSAIVTLGLATAIVGVYYLFPDFIINVSVGSQYLGISKQLSFMGVFVGIYTLCYFLVNFLLSLHKTKVVILPILAALAQVAILWNRHDTITQVIQTNVMVASLLLVSLFAYLGYNQLVRIRYAKTK